MSKKYSLTKETITQFGVTLFRIKAEKSFVNVTKGDLGGYIEKEENLAQDEDAEVSGDAWVSGNARVFGDAWVYGKIKLLAGYFFGTRYRKEEIRYVQIDEDNELIYKGEAKFGDDEPEAKSLHGKVVKVELGGVSYTARIE